MPRKMLIRYKAHHTGTDIIKISGAVDILTENGPNLKAALK